MKGSLGISLNGSGQKEQKREASMKMKEFDMFCSCFFFLFLFFNKTEHKFPLKICMCGLTYGMSWVKS